MNKIIYTLKLNSSDEHKTFTQKSIPNIEESAILGVKFPIIKKMATSIDWDFLSCLPHKYLEENILHMYMINNIKELSIQIKYIELFLPYIDNWAITDSIKINKINDSILVNITNWFKTNKTYYIRLGVVIFIKYYKNYNEDILSLIKLIKNDDYYVKMVIAWYYCELFIHNFKEMDEYFSNNIIDEWILKKTISKCIDSFRITDYEKDILKLKYRK